MNIKSKQLDLTNLKEIRLPGNNMVEVIDPVTSLKCVYEVTEIIYKLARKDEPVNPSELSNINY